MAIRFEPKGEKAAKPKAASKPVKEAQPVNETPPAELPYGKAKPKAKPKRGRT